ncbi:MAG TPA: NUDIX domain-containing protein [Solirubrobacteraceae bacterium]
MPASLRLRRLGYRLAYRLLTAWWFVRRPDAEGVKCLLTHGQEVLLVQHTYGPAVWDLPGGAVKRDEPPLTAAGREMAEELGIADADWQAAGTIHGRQSFRRDTIHCFRAELPSRTVAPNAAELAETRWFPRRALPDPLGLYAAALLGERRR